MLAKVSPVRSSVGNTTLFFLLISFLSLQISFRFV